MIALYDIVFSTKKLSENVPIGSKGTILMIYQAPNIAYEVEFVDENNNTLDILTVNYEDIIKNE